MFNAQPTGTVISRRLVKEGHRENVLVKEGHGENVLVKVGHGENVLVKVGHGENVLVKEGHGENVLVKVGHGENVLVKVGHGENVLVKVGHGENVGEQASKADSDNKEQRKAKEAMLRKEGAAEPPPLGANPPQAVKGATPGPRKQTSAGQGLIHISVTTETGDSWEGRCAGVSRSAK